MIGEEKVNRSIITNRAVRYYTSFNNTIANVLAERGWTQVNEDDDWDVVWADRDWTYASFDRLHLQPWQRLNHFRNGRELCRKDLMAKNMKRKRKELEREGKTEEAASYSFIPTTFLLPKEYSMFVEEFKKTGGVWIMKPIGSAQGKGIFLFSKLHEISEWKTDFKALRNANSSGNNLRSSSEKKEVEAYIVQRYLQFPLLIGGKKFDLRLYALVTSFSPLRVYQYRRGFARFTNSRYSSDIQNIYDSFMHLTNVAIQKTADNYDERTGGKMELQALKLYLTCRYGVETVDALFWEIQMIILKSLLAVQPVMINDRHCYELYGYDIIIDENLRPWLLEVNASPSLTANTPEDEELKMHMLHGMWDIVDVTGQLHGDEEHVSGWDLIYENGYIEINPEQCPFTSFLGAAVPPSPYETIRMQQRDENFLNEVQDALSETNDDHHGNNEDEQQQQQEPEDEIKISRIVTSGSGKQELESLVQEQQQQQQQENHVLETTMYNQMAELQL